jgi:hypothetical protein
MASVSIISSYFRNAAVGNIKSIILTLKKALKLKG